MPETIIVHHVPKFPSKLDFPYDNACRVKFPHNDGVCVLYLFYNEYVKNYINQLVLSTFEHIPRLL